MGNVMNPDGTHKLIAGYSHAAGLQERDQRIAELEAKLREVANIMHHGGLMGLTDNDARRLLIPYWDQDECARLAAQPPEEGSSDD